MWLLYAALAVAAVVLLRWRFKRGYKTYGSAQWLKPWTAARKGLFGLSGVPLGDWSYWNLPVRFNQDGHILTVAPPGGGKSVTGSIPSGLARTIKSRFVADPDPDAEVTAVCIDYWRKECEAVFVINPAGMFSEAPWSLPSHRFDPMKFVDPASPEFGKRARYLASALISRSLSEDGQTEYFKSEGANKLAAFIAFGAIKRAKLPQIRDWIGLPVAGDGGAAPYRNQLHLWEEMAAEPALEGMISRHGIDLRDKYENAPEEFQAILSTIRNAVEFLDDPAIRDAVSADEVDWAALKRGSAVVALTMARQDWKIFAPFVRLAFLSAIWTLEDGPVARHRVHMLLEEFPTLGRLDFFADVLATGRKKKAQIEVVVQNIGQLESLYPEWKALLPNFEVRRFKAVRDLDTARYVSDTLGTATIAEKNPNNPGYVELSPRLLMTPDEVMAMHKHFQIVFIGNNRPAKLGQIPYFLRMSERRRALPDPFYPGGMPPLPNIVWPQLLIGQAVRVLAYVAGPHPQVVIALLAFLIWWSDPHILISQDYKPPSPILRCQWLGWKGTVNQATAAWRTPECSPGHLWTWF